MNSIEKINTADFSHLYVGRVRCSEGDTVEMITDPDEYSQASLYSIYAVDRDGISTAIEDADSFETATEIGVKLADQYGLSLKPYRSAEQLLPCYGARYGEHAKKAISGVVASLFNHAPGGEEPAWGRYLTLLVDQRGGMILARRGDTGGYERICVVNPLLVWKVARFLSWVSGMPILGGISTPAKRDAQWALSFTTPKGVMYAIQDDTAAGGYRRMAYFDFLSSLEEFNESLNPALRSEIKADIKRLRRLMEV